MKNRHGGRYDQDVEMEKGATLDAASYDKTQKIKVSFDKVTVGGKSGRLEISGIATGKQNAKIDGTISLWLSIFRYMRPDGAIDHVAGWNITTSLSPGQTSDATAKTLVEHINASTRPYRAVASGGENNATIKIIFVAK